jgi:hypothetical protein
MSDALATSTDFLIKMSETVGPVGAIFIFIGVVAVVVGSTALLYRIKRKGFKSLVEKEVDKILNKVEETEEDITIVLELMRNVAQAILSINQKMKYTLSDKDSVIILKLITTGNLLLNIITQSMMFSADVKDKPGEIIELKSQFILELKNKWMDYIDNLNLFRSSLRIGDFIDKNHKFRFFNDDIVAGEIGLVYQITEIVFNLNIVAGMKYSRIKTIFSRFSQDVIRSLEFELNKIMNGGE